MTQPTPFKFVCPKCGYSKVVRPKSDALSAADLLSSCPKCKVPMQKADLSVVDNIFEIFK